MTHKNCTDLDERLLYDRNEIYEIIWLPVCKFEPVCVCVCVNSTGKMRTLSGSRDIFLMVLTTSKVSSRFRFGFSVEVRILVRAWGMYYIYQSPRRDGDQDGVTFSS